MNHFFSFGHFEQHHWVCSDLPASSAELKKNEENVMEIKNDIYGDVIGEKPA
jgi:hypothetical protein